MLVTLSAAQNLSAPMPARSSHFGAARAILQYSVRTATPFLCGRNGARSDRGGSHKCADRISTAILTGRRSGRQMHFVGEFCKMDELIELSYRRFPRHVIEKLVRTGFLRSSERHKPEAVAIACDRFRQHVEIPISPATIPGHEVMRKPASAPTDVATSYYRTKKGKYRRRTDVPISKPVKGKRRR